MRHEVSWGGQFEYVTRIIKIYKSRTGSFVACCVVQHSVDDVRRHG
jgi:hypothetical protein